jgi:hypothetical protein
MNYTWVRRKRGDLLLAHGRDPYFPGWPDTLQLNYGNPATQEAMIGELMKIVGQCDGVRCDMAMLVLPEVFERTWGIPAKSFWPNATRRVRKGHQTLRTRSMSGPQWTMQQLGSITFTTNGCTTDCAKATLVRCASISSRVDYQNKLVRFLRTMTSRAPRRRFPPTARGSRGNHFLARPSLLPSGTIRRADQTHLSALGPRPG